MVGFIGKVTRFESKDTVKLPLKGDAKDELSFMSLKQLVDDVDGLQQGSALWLNPLLFNGDLQTIYLAAGDYSQLHKVYYGRRVIHFSDGGSTAVDYAIQSTPDEFDQLKGLNIPEDYPKLHPRTRFLSGEEIEKLSSDDTKPMVLICHGLGGGSHEPLIRNLVDRLSAQGFQAAVLMTRGCARSKLTTPELFCGLATDDIRHFVKELQREFPNRPLYAAGFSFGATLLANYVGEENEKCVFKSICLLSNPWDLVESSARIKTRFLSRYLFNDSVTSFLTRMIKSNRKALAQDSEFFTEQVLNARYPTPADFDNNVTAKYYGFASAFDYYRCASSIQRVKHIHVPTLSINSTDDPIVSVYTIPSWDAEANPYFVQVSTDIGGHLAYLQRNGDSWAVNKIVDYLSKFHQLVDVSKPVMTDYRDPKSKFDYKIKY